MAFDWEDTFDSYNDGDLAGQGNWVTIGPLGVAEQVYSSGDPIYHGTKALRFTRTGSGGLGRQFTQQTDGVVNMYFYLESYVEDGDESKTFGIRQGIGSGAIAVARIKGAISSSSFDLVYDHYSSGEITLASDIPTDQWNKLSIEIRSSDKYVRIGLNGTWYSWYPPANNFNWSQAEYLAIFGGHLDNGANMFVDRITFRDTADILDSTISIASSILGDDIIGVVHSQSTVELTSSISASALESYIVASSTLETSSSLVGNARIGSVHNQSTMILNSSIEGIAGIGVMIQQGPLSLLSSISGDSATRSRPKRIKYLSSGNKNQLNSYGRRR